jgi:hypothetical protein
LKRCDEHCHRPPKASLNIKNASHRSRFWIDKHHSRPYYTPVPKKEAGFSNLVQFDQVPSRRHHMVEVTPAAHDQIAEYFKNKEAAPIRIFLNEGG